MRIHIHILVMLLVGSNLACDNSINASLIWYTSDEQLSENTHLVFLNGFRKAKHDLHDFKKFTCQYLDTISVGLPVTKLIFLATNNVYKTRISDVSKVDSDHFKDDQIRKNHILTIQLGSNNTQQAICKAILYYKKGPKFNFALPIDSTQAAYFERRIKNHKD